MADATRRAARRLENELDSKLVLFGASCAPSGGTTFEILRREIEHALQELEQVNDRMSRDAAGTSGGTATHMHMLQRHREILHDFQQEFNKLRSARRAASEREELLSSVRQDIREHRSATDMLLRERSAIHGSDRAADEALGTASATCDALASQRSGMGGVGGKLRQLASVSPQINSLIGMIGRRKRRDKVVLGCVIGVCSAILVIYTFG